MVRTSGRKIIGTTKDVTDAVKLNFLQANYYDKATIDGWNLIKNYALENDLNALGKRIYNAFEVEADTFKCTTAGDTTGLQFVFQTAAYGLFVDPNGNLTLQNKTDNVNLLFVNLANKNIEFGWGGYKIRLTSDGYIEFHDLKAKGIITEPPYDNTIFWLGAIGYAIEDLAITTSTLARLTSAQFTDMAIKTRLFADGDYGFCRHYDITNYYAVFMDADLATADHQIKKEYAGTETVLATEAVDLAKQWYWIKFESVGSTLNSYRAPDPYSDPPTTPTLTATDTDITVDEGDNRLMVVPEGVNLREVVRGLNAIGVSPRDLISIFQAIRASGALQAELVII